jgi:transcriptional regulator with XRE-family HTH domain
MDNTESEVVRLRELLRHAIRVSNVTNREIERRLGISQGSLSRLLAGGIELKVQHVLDILAILGLHPGTFFEVAYPDPPKDQSSLQLIHAAMNRRDKALGGPAPSQPTQEQIEAMVSKALRKLLMNDAAAGE